MNRALHTLALPAVLAFALGCAFHPNALQVAERPQKAFATEASFEQEEVTFESAGTRMTGTLTIPKAEAGRKVPALILVHGSSSSDRDYTFPLVELDVSSGSVKTGTPISDEWAIKPFRQIAEYCSSHGCAVLRYDKRGYGKKIASADEWTLRLLCNDVISAATYLKGRPEIDPDRIFILGHSAGGLIAEIVATELPWIRGILLLSAAATPYSELTLRQTAHVMRQQGYSEEDIEENLQNLRNDHKLIRNGQYEPITFGGIPTAHMRDLLDYDAEAQLRKLPTSTSVLILGGGKDWISPPDEAVRLYEVSTESGHSDVDLHIFSQLDHFLLFEPGVSRLETFLTRRRNVPAAVNETIGLWLNAHTGGHQENQGERGGP